VDEEEKTRWLAIGIVSVGEEASQDDVMERGADVEERVMVRWQYHMALPS
jgi:hypothetical protein